MFTVENRVGKLLEVRYSSPTNFEEARDLQMNVASCLAKLPGNVITCADFRGMTVVAPELGDLFVGMLRKDNNKIARNGYLINGSAILGLQLERVLREVNHPGRRAFRHRVELEQWLDEALAPNEQGRMRVFLDGGAS